MEREKRGRTLFEQKWARNLAQWDTAVREAAEARARKEHPDLEGEFAKAQAPGATPFDTYETLSIRDIKAMADPQWLVHGMVVEQSMGFIFGPPGCLKTFIALELALSLTTGPADLVGAPGAAQGRGDLHLLGGPSRPSSSG